MPRRIKAEQIAQTLIDAKTFIMTNADGGINLTFRDGSNLEIHANMNNTTMNHTQLSRIGRHAYVGHALQQMGRLISKE